MNGPLGHGDNGRGMKKTNLNKLNYHVLLLPSYDDWLFSFVLHTVSLLTWTVLPRPISSAKIAVEKERTLT